MRIKFILQSNIKYYLCRGYIKTPVKISEIEFIEKKSRFLGYIIPAPTVEEFKEFYETLKKEHQRANHVAYAYKIKTETDLKIKFYDDGEVSGTAGKPILNHIEGNDLINAAVFVVRYFGGIRLGAGGLGRAYSAAARRAIEAAIVEEYVEFLESDLALGTHICMKKSITRQN